MKICSINTIPYTQPQSSPSFAGRGKPLTLQYIVEKRSYLIPARVLEQAKKILERGRDDISLKELHRLIYAPLMDCTTLDEAKAIFPEFQEINNEVVFSRDTIYKREFEARTKDINFPLKLLQELWFNLKTKDEVAQELGMTSRSSLDWALKQIGFVYFPSNYRAILNASDEEGNRIIASKTQAWNALHPDLMRKRNKHAAQFCKTPEYRSAQAQRMREYDQAHPERREKIAEADRQAWALCPEIKEAMAQFAMGETAYVRKIIMKSTHGETLNEREARAEKGFYKRFWAAHPELRRVLSEAKRQVRESMNPDKISPSGD